MVSAKKIANKKSNSVNKISRREEPLNFKSAFKYPFNRAKGMWNILWVLLPIFGWLALGGYSVRIVRNFIDGNFKELPLFSFKSDMKLGFFMFLKAIPFILVYVVAVSILGLVSESLSSVFDFLASVLVIPILGINFIKKELSILSSNLKKVKFVFDNFSDYIVTFLKGFALALVFIVMILVLVGIPGLIFTCNIFLADFYRRKVKQ